MVAITFYSGSGEAAFSWRLIWWTSGVGRRRVVPEMEDLSAKRKTEAEVRPYRETCDRSIKTGTLQKLAADLRGMASDIQVALNK